MQRLSRLALMVVLTLSIALVGCDFTSRRDLKEAEKALKEADKWNAEHWAEREYRKAQACFIEALDYAKVRLVNESRDKAAECKLWAEEATDLAKIRFFEMQEEKERLGAYKP